MASPASGPSPLALSTITNPFSNLAKVTAVNPIVPDGVRPTAGWQLYDGATPIGVATVSVDPSGFITVQAGTGASPTRAVYDGSDATLQDASGAVLVAFDELIPYP